MPVAYVNIGSNRGDREAMIGRAVALIADAFPASGLRVSASVESPPWGYESSRPFLNVGVAFSVDISPAELLSRLLGIEKSISPDPHRNPDGSYRDRAIDIDLIAVDSLVIHADFLSLPHPRMHLRPFVLIPMMQLAPEWRHPLLGLTPGQLLENSPQSC